MGNSVLHAIVIHELRNSNPTFHKEYCTLVDGISQQIRQVTKEHTKAIQHTCFIETFDRSKVARGGIDLGYRMPYPSSDSLKASLIYTGKSIEGGL